MALPSEQKDKYVHISFAILYDLRPITRHDADIPETKEGVKLFIEKMIDLFNDENPDPTYFFREVQSLDQVYNHLGILVSKSTQINTLRDRPAQIDGIIEKLLNNRYYVINRINKHNVIAFALNYTRFEVYSKDCDKELITWRDDNANDLIIRQIHDPNYNENPVIRFMCSLNC